MLLYSAQGKGELSALGGGRGAFTVVSLSSEAGTLSLDPGVRHVFCIEDSEVAVPALLPGLRVAPRRPPAQC